MRKWLPLVPVLLSTFMLLLDVTIVGVAIPSMATTLDSSFAALQWTMDLYVLLLASFLLPVGSASDRLGRRRVFLIGLLIFTAASLACGIAPDSGVLIAFRGVQGFGASAILATNAALIQGSYTGRDRGTAFGVWGGVMGGAAAAGPILGGLLIQHISWRAIFLVNIPVGIAAIILSVRTLKESKNPSAPRIDLAGTVALTASVTLLVYGLIEAASKGWGDTVSVSAFVGAVVFLVAFGALEARRKHRMLDLALFLRPSFSALMLGGAILQASAFGYVIFVSVWAQSLLGMDPIKGGLILMPLCGVACVVGVLGGRLLHNVPAQYVIGTGLLLVGGGCLLNTMVSTDSSWPVLLPGLFATGVGVGLASFVLAAATLAAVPPERAGMATGTINTFRQVGYAVAVPLCATVLAGGARHVLSGSGLFRDPSAASAALVGGHAQSLIASTPGRRDLIVRVLHDAYANGLDRVFLGSGIAALAAGVIVLLLVRPGARPAPGPAQAPSTAAVAKLSA